MDPTPPLSHQQKICEWCNHSLMNNIHGWDQNDFIMVKDALLSKQRKMIHGGKCTYCIHCRSLSATK